MLRTTIANVAKVTAVTTLLHLRCQQPPSQNSNITNRPDGRKAAAAPPEP
jgi:hypothetical protein